MASALVWCVTLCGVFSLIIAHLVLDTIDTIHRRECDEQRDSEWRNIEFGKMLSRKRDAK